MSWTLPGQKESQASVEFIFVQFRQCIRSSSQQATHRDRQTDSQTGQKGAPGRGNYHRKTKCSLLSIFFHLPPVTQMTEQSAAAIKLSSSAVWEIFALCNLCSTGAVDKEADTTQATDRDKRSDSHSLACHSAAPPYLQRWRCS